MICQLYSEESQLNNMSEERKSRNLHRIKGKQPAVGSGAPLNHELDEGVPEFRMTEGGLVMYVRSGSQMYRRELDVVQKKLTDELADERCYFTSASSTALTASAYLPIGGVVTPTSTIGFVMPRDGSITALSVCFDVSNYSSGNDKWQVQIRKNGVEVSNFSQLVVTTSNGVKEAYVAYTPTRTGITRFVAGDVLNIYMNYSVTLGSTTVDDIIANIEVAFDKF